MRWLVKIPPDSESESEITKRSNRDLNLGSANTRNGIEIRILIQRIEIRLRIGNVFNIDSGSKSYLHSKLEYQSYPLYCIGCRIRIRNRFFLFISFCCYRKFSGDQIFSKSIRIISLDYISFFLNIKISVYCYQVELLVKFDQFSANEYQFSIFSRKFSVFALSVCQKSISFDAVSVDDFYFFFSSSY